MAVIASEPPFDVQELHAVQRGLRNDDTLFSKRVLAVIDSLIAELGQHDPIMWGDGSAPRPQGVLYANPADRPE